MDCKTVRKNINNFIEDNLEERELQDFIDHISHCTDCKEELSIQFLVTEGLSELESSSSFDIQGKLEEKLNHGYRISRLRHRMKVFMYICEVLVLIAVIVMVIILILK